MRVKNKSFRRYLYTGIAVVACHGCFPLLNSNDAVAQDTTSKNSSPAEPPVLLQSDEAHYDEALNLFIAKGNVELMQDGRILLADTLSYSQTNDTVTASGNVRIMEPTGDVMFAEYVELTNKLSTGALHKIRILMKDNAQLAANGARKINDTTTELSKAVYSPCEVCKEDPNKSPLWQVKADRVVHDKEAKTIEYYNSWMEIAGVPIAYSPYFQHPDPSVNRSSGFLPPSFGSDSDFGTFVRAPYFVAISEDKDATIDPIYTTDNGIVYSGEYRQAFVSGDFSVNASFLNSDDWTDNGLKKTDNSRWHIASIGQFDIDKTWRWGFDLNRESDRRYMDQYSFWGDPGNTLDSQIYFEGFRKRNFLKAEALAWQDLRATRTVEQPLIYPNITYTGFGEVDSYGGRWEIDSSVRHLKQKSASESIRTSAKAGYGINKTSDFGLVTSYNASLQADLYKTEHKDGSSLNEDINSRFTPRVSSLSRLPLYQVTSSGTQIIEPMAGIFAAPNGGHDQDIRNDDSLVVEQDEFSLFQEDMSPGIDRMETGTRASYGLRLAHYFENTSEIQGMIAQAYRFSEDATLLRETGIDEGASDYFGSLTIRPNDFVDLSYRFRLDQEDFGNARNETQLTLGKGRTYFTTRYTDIAQDNDPSSTAVEELYLSGSLEVDNYWRTTGYWLHDLSEENSRNAGMSLIYEDECFIFSTVYARDFTADNDSSSSDSIMLRFTFKTLGEFEQNVGQ